MSRNRHSSGGLVYSTEGGRMCPGCRKTVAECGCQRPSAVPAGDGVGRVSRESKGRGGKVVTLVRGLPMAPDALLVLGKTLRTACGSGGTVKDGVIEIQGDHAERVMAALQAQGMAVKRTGG
jgi:translation initiation factor 1